MKEITEAFSIPFPCPKCEGELITIKYGDPHKFLMKIASISVKNVITKFKLKISKEGYWRYNDIY